MPRRTARSLSAPNAFWSRPGDEMNAGTSSTRNEIEVRAVPERAEALVRRGLHHSREAAGVRECRRQHDGEPAQQDDELHQVHPGRPEQAARGEVRRSSIRRRSGTRPTSEGRRPRSGSTRCRRVGRRGSRGSPSQQHRRDQPAHGPAEVMLEQVAASSGTRAPRPGARPAGRSRTRAASDPMAADPFHHQALSPSRYPRPVAPTVEPAPMLAASTVEKMSAALKLAVRDEETRRRFARGG